MNLSKEYSPPLGYYDLPFTWVFDASGLPDRSDALGSSIYLIGGYGDFALRRIVGLKFILAADSAGMFQINRKFPNVYLQSEPIRAVNSLELPIVPEEWYPETGHIRFDLYGVSPIFPTATQLLFQGIRRQKGKALGPSREQYDPKSYTYEVDALITDLSPAGPYVTNTRIVDYDFELYQVMIFAQSGTDPLSPSGLVCSLQIFDSNRVAISNLPISDLYFNGAPGTLCQNGALVPPLYYPANSTLQIDFYSQQTDPASLPTSIVVYLIGRQLIPC